jgi:hypothetical protein
MVSFNPPPPDTSFERLTPFFSGYYTSTLARHPALQYPVIVTYPIIPTSWFLGETNQPTRVPRARDVEGTDMFGARDSVAFEKIELSWGGCS